MPKMAVHGLNMYYELTGEVEPVVFVSGLGGDHQGWALNQVPAFIAAGYRCLVFNNRDAGRTGDSPIASYTVRQFADDTAALMRRMASTRRHRGCRGTQTYPAFLLGGVSLAPSGHAPECAPAASCPPHFAGGEAFVGDLAMNGPHLLPQAPLRHLRPGPRPRPR